jgi:hypothetical protein
MEIRKERGFPQRLEKSLANDARLFHGSHRPGGGYQLRLTSRVGPNETIERGQIKLAEALIPCNWRTPGPCGARAV